MKAVISGAVGARRGGDCECEVWVVEGEFDARPMQVGKEGRTYSAML